MSYCLSLSFIDVFPKWVLGVKYGNLEVKLGNTFEPIQVKNPPILTWNADPEKLYLLCMTDPDVPLRLYPIYREFHHWLVGNIPGAEISMGEILTDYVGAGPPKGTGLHRYILLIYEQPGKLAFDEKHLTIRTGKGREKFSIRDFAKKYKLGDPIAGNFYLAEWDDYVPNLYKQMNISV
ncbi:unnamed protein product [Orchesella dallaii]|uniref:Uncharacterized protein n=1 Tax=Orchesella dallaii TaxID=48710 RepID=A0ABP1S4W5_9HEXA